MVIPHMKLEMPHTTHTYREYVSNYIETLELSMNSPQLLQEAKVKSI